MLPRLVTSSNDMNSRSRNLRAPQAMGRNKRDTQQCPARHIAPTRRNAGSLGRGRTLGAPPRSWPQPSMGCDS